MAPPVKSKPDEPTTTSGMTYAEFMAKPLPKDVIGRDRRVFVELPKRQPGFGPAIPKDKTDVYVPPGATPGPTRRPNEWTRGTLADRSSFRPREVLQPTTADFKGNARLADVVAAEEQERLRRVMDAPLPAQVWDRVSDIFLEDEPEIGSYRAPAPLVTTSVQIKNEPETHLIPRSAPIRFNQRITWDTFLNFLRTGELIASSENSVSANDEIVVAFSLSRKNASVGLSVMSVAQAAAIEFKKDVGLLYFVPVPGYGLVLSNAKGGESYDATLEWMRGVNIIPVDSLEEAIATARFDTGVHNEEEDTIITWGAVKAYGAYLGSMLGARILQLQPATLAGIFNDQSDFVFAMSRIASGDDALTGGFRVMTPEEAEAEDLNANYAQVGMHYDTRVGHHVVSTVKGKGALEFGIEVVVGMGVVVDSPAQKAMLARMWKGKLGKNDPQQTWDEFCNYLATGGLKQLLVTWSKATGRALDKDMVLLADKTSKQTTQGIEILTKAEADQLGKDGRARVDIQIIDGTVTVKEGRVKTAREITERIQAGGGITLAPDAAEMDKQAQSLRPQPEGFALPDPSLSKPEPLVTPADTIKLAPLPFPADAVALPEAEGYQIIDPELARKWNVMVTDKIPVPTRDRDDPVVAIEPEDVGAIAAASAMVIGIISLFYGGGAMLRAPAFGSAPLTTSPGGLRTPEGT